MKIEHTFSVTCREKNSVLVSGKYQGFNFKLSLWIWINELKVENYFDRRKVRWALKCLDISFVRIVYSINKKSYIFDFIPIFLSKTVEMTKSFPVCEKWPKFQINQLFLNLVKIEKSCIENEWKNQVWFRTVESVF